MERTGIWVDGDTATSRPDTVVAAAEQGDSAATHSGAADWASANPPTAQRQLGQNPIERPKLIRNRNCV